MEVLFTNAPKHATQIAEAAVKRRCDIVVAVGGDGSVNEIGKALVSTDTALAIIPTGSGNGLARHLGIPLEASRAIDVISEGQMKTIDSVQINDQFYFGIAGIGFDAQISWDFAEYGRRGFLSYLLLTLKQFPSYQPRSYELVIDGDKIEKEAFLVSFANGSQFGNGVAIAPEAQIDDGYLDVVVLKKFPKTSLARLVWKLFHHTIHHSRYVETFRCKKVSIQEPNLRAHIDGEPVFFPDGMKLEVVPSSLKVLVPFGI